MTSKGLAVITGATSGIGLELARLCAQDGYDVLIAANEALAEKDADALRLQGAKVETVEADLATEHGVTALWEKLQGRSVDLLLANAGRGLGDAFLDQDWGEVKKVIDLNVTGTTSLIQKVGRQMRDRNQGRILITGSTAGFIPGAFQAVYNGTKAYLDSFAYALRNELKETEVTVTVLMPGPTDTEFFERADLEDSSVGKSQSKEDPAKTAKNGYEAMMKGKPGVVSGLMNKIQVAFAGVIPDTVLAEMHRHMAEPESRAN